MNNRTIFEAMERFEKGIKLLAYWGWRALPVVEDAVRRKDQHPEGGGGGGRERALELLYRFAPFFRELHDGFDDITDSLGAGRPFAGLIQRATGSKPAGDLSPASDQEPDAEAAPWVPPSEDEFAEWECPPWLRDMEQTPRKRVPAGVAKTRKATSKLLRINWRHHKKCGDPFVADRIIEVSLRLRGEAEDTDFRLEAVRPAGGGDYEVAIYRRKIVTEPPPDHEPGEPSGVRKEFHAWVHYELIRSSHHSADKALDQVLGFLECRCE